MVSAKFLSFDEFENTLVFAQDRFHKRLDTLEKLVAANRFYLFGYGGKGRTLAWQIASGSDIKVTVYDSSPKARDLAAKDGFQTLSYLDELRQTEYGVILGACQAQLEQAALVQNNHVFYQEAAYLFDVAHLANKARDFSIWISCNMEAIYEIYISIHPESRETLTNILRFRLSLDPHDLIPSKNKNTDMWFDVPEHHSQRNYATFLDVGAYDGDTLLQAQHRLSVNRGIAVEANISLFDSIKNVARFYENGIQIMPHAAWSHKCRLHFSEVRGGMISVSEADDGELDASPIDEGVHERVDLIKMDIEGAEIRALEGCRRILKTGPDLAIAAYHRPDDLVQIPDFLENAGYVRTNFDFHVAHYSDCFDDTIIFFLKKQ